MKKINFKKYVNFDFVKRFSFNPKKYIGLSFKKLIDFNFKKYIYFTFKKYSKFRILFLYLLGVFVILPTIYLSIPTFFDYEKSKKLIEDKIYSDFNLKSSIEGKIKYRFFPSPRIKVENLIIKDFLDGKKNLGEVELASIKIPIKNLATFDKMIFKELELKNPLIYVDMNKSKKYKEYFSKHFKSKDIKISDATIKLSDGTNSIATIEKTKIQYDSKEKLKEATLKGKIFNKSILINFKNKIDSNTPNVIFIKYPSLNFRTSIVLYKPDESNNVEGKASFFINRFKGNFFFDLKEDLIKIKKGNIRNKFFNGKILGDISFLPFFNFDLDLNLFSLNFRSLSKVLMQMSNEDINDFLILNNKINGNLNLTINKIYASSKIIKSLESRIKFNNRDIILDQMLFDLGKLGATDITGIIKNKNNKINLLFKQNFFMDNPKYFFSKFGLYNKNTEPKSFYFSGRFNFSKPKLHLTELVADDNLSKDDISFYEQEFNDILLENGYRSLLSFVKLKEFIKLINVETAQSQ